MLRIGDIGLCASPRLAGLGLRAICGLLFFAARLGCWRNPPITSGGRITCHLNPIGLGLMVHLLNKLLHSRLELRRQGVHTSTLKSQLLIVSNMKNR